MSDKKINVVMTGATGCIGRNIIDLANEYNIHALHRLSSDVSEIKQQGVNCIPLNFYSPDMVYRAFYNIVDKHGPIDAVIHLASNLTHDPSERDSQFKFNIDVTKHLLNAYSLFGSQDAEKPHFIYTSTAAVRKLDNEYRSKIKDYHCGYIASKKLAELELNIFEDYFKTTILRPGIVVGKYDRSNYAQLFKVVKNRELKKAFPGSLPFCNAKNVAQAHINAINLHYCYSNFIELDKMYYLGGDYLSWLEFFNMLAAKMKVQPYSETHSVTGMTWLITAMGFLSWVKCEKPLMYDSMVDLMMTETEDFPIKEYVKTKKDLLYCSLLRINEAVDDCYNYLVSKGDL